MALLVMSGYEKHITPTEFLWPISHLTTNISLLTEFNDSSVDVHATLVY